MGSQGSQSHNHEEEQKAPLHFSLENILSGDAENSEFAIPKEKAEQGWDEEGRDHEAAVGYCIECEGTYSRLLLSSSTHFHLIAFQLQTNLHNFAAKLVKTTSVKFALLHSTGKVRGRGMPLAP